MIVLALATGIAPDVWAAQGERAIVTALDLLKQQTGRDGPGRVVASG